MPETNDPSRSPTPRLSVALGMFVVVQLVFLVVQNFFSYAQEQREEMPSQVRAAVNQLAPDWPEKKGHLWNAMEGSTQLTSRWAQATLQLQQWSLFAPSIGTDCFFPALLLSDEAPPAAPVDAEEGSARYRVRGKVIRSENEPADMQRYFRFGSFRLRKFENALFPFLRPYETEKPQETLERYRDKIKEYTQANMEMLGGYVRYRFKQSGEPTPRQVILLMRHYVLTGPQDDAFVTGPFTLPFARWQPQAGNALEPFNPMTHCFEPLFP